MASSADKPQTQPVEDRCECTRRSYAVEVPVEKFIALERWLGDRPLTERVAPNYCKLANEMQAAVPSITGIEFNGHFRNYVYFTLDANDDLPESRASIVRIIDRNVAAAWRAARRRNTA